jgi:hypothetical protein
MYRYFLCGEIKMVNDEPNMSFANCLFSRIMRLAIGA